VYVLFYQRIGKLDLALDDTMMLNILFFFKSCYNPMDIKLGKQSENKIKEF
jgi:hypothetical protein